MRIKFLFRPILLLLAYIGILSFNLLELPMYLDEGLYIFWSYLLSTDPGFAYISMQDGKTPLFIWVTAYINQWFNSFLFSGRFISVLASTISLTSWALIAGKILGRKSFHFVFVIFLLTPFNILISRLAFVDSLLVGFGSLSILGIFFLRESVLRKQIVQSLLFALLAGLSLGLAFFTKTTAKIFLYAEIFILVIWVLQFLRVKNFKSAIVLIVGGAIIAGLYFELIGYLKFGALRHWEMIANKESVLVFSLPEIYRRIFKEHNIGIYFKNFPFLAEYLLIYFGTILLFFAAGTVWILKQRKHIWLLLLVLILTGGVFLSAKIPASRYFAIIVPEVLLVSTFGLFWIWQKKSQSLKILSIVFLLISGFFSLKMIADPLNAYYSSDDRANLIDYNLNAIGLKESIDFLDPKKETAAVGVTGIWGVAEGANVSFKERGIEVYTLGKFIESHQKNEESCEKDFKELEGKCWKINFGDLAKSQKSEKYVYLITEQISINSLKRIVDFEIAKEFIRPRTNLNVYLIKLNSSIFAEGKLRLFPEN